MIENNTVVTIELDRIRELRFSHKAMKRWSAHTGKSITKMDTETIGPEDIEILMFYMLEKDAESHGEKLQLSEMEDLLDMVPVGVVYAKLSEAMAAAFPENKADEKNAKRAESLTGKNS